MVEEKGGLEAGHVQCRSKVVEHAIAVRDAVGCLIWTDGRSEKLDLDAELDLGGERWSSLGLGGEQSVLHDWTVLGFSIL